MFWGELILQQVYIQELVGSDSFKLLEFIKC